MLIIPAFLPTCPALHGLICACLIAPGNPVAGDIVFWVDLFGLNS